VLSDDYDEEENKLTAWNPTKYLFETDLITYSDTDVDGSALYLGNGNNTGNMTTGIIGHPIGILNTYYPLGNYDSELSIGNRK